MHATTARLLVAGLVCSVLTACAPSPSDEDELEAMLTPVPPGIARILVVDAAPAEVPMPGRSWSLATEVNFCPTRLRDPATGAVFALVQSEALAARGGNADQGSIGSRGNYRVSQGGPSLPAGTQLRVACGINRVIGLSSTASPGTE
jgi:hypothetical protein